MEDASPPTHEEVSAKAADGSLIDALFRDYGRIWLEEDSPTVLLLAEMHNAGEIDLLGIVSPEAIDRNRESFFEGQHLFERLIPKLSASVGEMFRFVEALRIGGGDDGAAGLHIEKFSTWCAADPTRPHELLALIDDDVPEAEGYLAVAIKAGVGVERETFVDRAYGFLRTGTLRQKQGALSALSQIGMPDEADWDRLVAALESALAADRDDAFGGQMLSSVAALLKTAPTERRDALEAIASTTIANGGDQTLHVAARLLAFETGSLSQRLQALLLEAMRFVPGANGGTFDLLDIGLARLVATGRVSTVRDFIRSLVTREADAVRLGKFDSVLRTVIDDPSGGLADWVVDWLLDGNDELCSAMDRAMFRVARNERPIEIDFSRYGLRDVDFAYLARKSVGSFFLKPLVMTSILAALLRHAPATVVEEVVEVLVDGVLKNYAGSARDYLSPIAADGSDPASRHAARALAEQDAYLDDLRSPGRVLELRPSERQRQLEWERHTDSMSDAMGKAKSKSILAQLATESVMLHGRRAVSWVDFPDEEPRRMETELGSFRTSFEVPRLDVVDPVGLQLQLLAFRAERRPQ